MVLLLQFIFFFRISPENVKCHENNQFMNVYMYIVKRNLNCDKCLSCFQEVLHYKATILKSFHLSVCFFSLTIKLYEIVFQYCKWYKIGFNVFGWNLKFLAKSCKWSDYQFIYYNITKRNIIYCEMNTILYYV